MSAERSLLAYTTPSDSTNLPSASVLFISTVLKSGNKNIYNFHIDFKTEQKLTIMPGPTTLIPMHYITLWVAL